MKGMFVVIASAMMLHSTTINTLAQRPRPWYRGNVRAIIRQLETDTDAFKSSIPRLIAVHSTALVLKTRSTITSSNSKKQPTGCETALRIANMRRMRRVKS